MTTPPHFYINPLPFQDYPTFIAKILVPPPKKNDSIFGRSYPLFNKGGHGSNYVQPYKSKAL